MERYFDLKTHKLAYRLQEMPGRPGVLFLHGCGANHTMFDDEFNAIGKDYSVAAISLRGQGKFTRPAGNRQEWPRGCYSTTFLINPSSILPVWIRY